MQDLAIEVVRIRNSFYRDSYRLCLLAILISSLITVLLICFALYERSRIPAPVYFATNQDGSLKILIPLNLPYVSDQDVLSFVTETVSSSLSYDFLNYRNGLQAVRIKFTPEGYQNFIDALEKSENLRTVLEKKFAVNAEFTGNPVILQQGVLPTTNTYAWRVQIPMIIHYISSQEEKSQPVLASVVVTRVSSLLNEYSIAIASLILEDKTQLIKQGENNDISNQPVQ